MATFCALMIFTDPLLQLSLDDSRNILYACTEKGTIQVGIILIVKSFQFMEDSLGFYGDPCPHIGILNKL